jgi:hypothetical protein
MTLEPRPLPDDLVVPTKAVRRVAREARKTAQGILVYASDAVQSGRGSAVCELMASANNVVACAEALERSAKRLAAE